MNSVGQPIRRYRFGAFEVDLQAGELRKHGIRLKLQEKPFQILLALLERAGQVVTREELHKQLWNGDTFVDFDHNLNNTVAKLREALNDIADTPRYIETLSRRGYRFLAPVQALNGAPLSAAVAAETTPPAASFKAISRRWLMLGLAAALVAAALGWGIWRALQPTIDFQARDWVLITRFENRTGEVIFDGMLEYALQRELSNSRFVNVVPGDRIGDALQLMKRPPNTQIDAAVGREVCLRDGGIRAMLSGQVEKAGTHYLLSVSLIDPTSGVSVASVEEGADSHDEILSAVRRLADGVRRTLGEQLPQIQLGKEGLEKATTSSLRALQLYSQGMTQVNQQQWAPAALLLEAAVAEDPDFASSHIYLAHCLSNLRRHDEAGPHYQRAFALADKTTDRERYFIQGTYYHRFKKDLRKAVEIYEVLVRLYPDDYWGANNLVVAYRSLAWNEGQREQAVKYFIRFAELRPNSFTSQTRVAQAIALWDNNLLRAKPFIIRARELASSETDRGSPELRAWFYLLPAIEYWLQGDPQKALAEVSRVEKTLASLGDKDHDAFLRYIAGFYWTLGKRKVAEELEEKIQDPRRLAGIAYAQGDYKLARQRFRATSNPGPVSVVLMARLGLLAEAEKALVRLSKEAWSDGAIKIVRGELAAARNRNKEAVKLLEEGVETSYGNLLTNFTGWESLANIWERQGNLEKAAQALEKSSGRRPWVFPTNADMWIVRRWRLAGLYRKLGRVAEAKAIEAELLKLLAVADPDFPILVELKHLRDSDTVPRKAHRSAKAQH